MGSSVLTGAFPRVGGVLHCGDVPAEQLAEQYGTPLYVYDLAWIRGRVAAFDEAFADTPHLLAYSVKANGNLGILRTLAQAGCGADITSGGELYRARTSGIPAERIVFAGVGKTRPEIEMALEEGIRSFNVESAGELRRIDEVATANGVVAPFGVRVNPDVFAETPHEYTRTGHSETKFGVPWSTTRELYQWALERPHLAPIGIDVHIGSQISDPAPYVSALDRVLELAEELECDGVPLQYLDIGGGFGINYDGQPGLDVSRLAGSIGARVRDAGLELILEPGRSLVGEAGLLLTRVEYVKRTAEKTFVIVDAGMTELIRPSHYGGYHAVESVGSVEGRQKAPVDVVGPICETGDFIALDREVVVPVEGEVLGVRTAGAYGFAMASNYNGRRRPAEVLVDGSQVLLGRRRESYADLIRGEE